MTKEEKEKRCEICMNMGCGIFVNQQNEIVCNCKRCELGNNSSDDEQFSTDWYIDIQNNMAT